MPRIAPFERHLTEYEQWFVRNRFAYRSELAAIRSFVSSGEKGVEIGVGSALFAQPLGIPYGVEPSAKMAALARTRGIKVVRGIGEQLPLRSAFFNFALMVTTVCFLDDVLAAFKETRRILKTGGRFVIGFIDRNSPIGKEYERFKEQSVFYRQADFYSVETILTYLKKAGFVHFRFKQTIFHRLPDIVSLEPVKDGWGEGSFVVIEAQK